MTTASNTKEQRYREQVRDAAIEIVQAHQAELSPTDLINELMNGNVNDQDARRAVWYLVARDRLLLTRDFKLRGASKAQPPMDGFHLKPSKPQSKQNRGKEIRQVLRKNALPVEIIDFDRTRIWGV